MAPHGEVGRVWTVRRPLVYRAVAQLTARGLVASGRTVASDRGPQRTELEVTAVGRRAVAGWLIEPVEHVRDARSLLMLKLLFLSRAGTDPAALLRAQHDVFAAIAERLTEAVDHADGFDRTLTLWRLESTTAALRFVATLQDESGPRDTARVHTW